MAATAHREKPRDRSDATPSFKAENDAAAGAPYGNMLEMIQLAEERDEAFKGAIQRTQWLRSLRAFRNQHHDSSKYRSEYYRNRTKLFRPKTRSAVRKNMASAAMALFSTNKVVSVSAEYDDDPASAASAAIQEELLNYRLDRTSTKSGIPWFLVSMGANQDSQIYGVCVSKQFWEYEIITEEFDEEVTETTYDLETGEVVTDHTGKPMIKKSTETVQEDKITKDRPMIMNVPPDNVIIDWAASWVAPAQSSAYLILKFPMTLDDARQMLKNPGKGNEAWLDLPDDVLLQATEDYTNKGIRVTRGGGVDRFDQRADLGPTGRDAKRNDIVWMYECFCRFMGVDYHFWSVGSLAYASKVRRTVEAYPEQMGERPVVYGVGQIETHEPAPMSAVYSWQELQSEVNDVVNLRLDTMKQALSPIAKVKQGALFDWKQLQNRASQDTTVIVRNMDDLEFDRMPDTTAGSYADMNYLNVDMDDLSATFSGSSIQSNRTLNETVGGMRLLNQGANSMTEFDLRVWTETWVEPVMRQTMRLEQFYETDAHILAVCGNRAKLQRFGVDQVTDDLLTHETSIKVAVGIGSSDPIQKLSKLGQALQMLRGVAPFFDKKVLLKAEEFIPEIMGPAGYNDGMRFFDIQPMDQSQASPEQQKAQMEGEIRKAEAQAKAMTADKEIQADAQKTQMELASEEKRDQLRLTMQQAIAALNARSEQAIVAAEARSREAIAAAEQRAQQTSDEADRRSTEAIAVMNDQTQLILAGLEALHEPTEGDEARDKKAGP